MNRMSALIKGTSKSSLPPTMRGYGKLEGCNPEEGAHQKLTRLTPPGPRAVRNF